MVLHEHSDDDEDEDEEEEEEQPQPPPPRRLPARKNRGAKMSEQLKNIDNEEFWRGKELFDLDEENEMDYSTESDEEDVVDSDFDDSESEESESEVKVAKEKRVVRTGYVDPAKRPGKRREPLGKNLTAGTAPTSLKRKQPTPSIPLERRKSSRASTIESTMEANKRQEEDSKKIRKKGSRKVHKILTQEEQMEEAKKTEQANAHSLKSLLEYEEQMKKIERQQKPKYTGPRVITRSKKGQPDTITFTNGDFTVYQKCTPKRIPGKILKCVVTGLEARYRDPITKMPYANIAAFKQLREIHTKNPKQLVAMAQKHGIKLEQPV
mmetsp:Transcript_19761/g.27437  ORF Transcript_19761/g.27437 Transcript_19761/m.27437 type:complete len:323 (-) Transcript_19761:53-1021(-)|eukprot:jgi/Bigna1/146098/aug1.109_g20806